MKTIKCPACGKKNGVLKNTLVVKCECKNEFYTNEESTEEQSTNSTELSEVLAEFQSILARLKKALSENCDGEHQADLSRPQQLLAFHKSLSKKEKEELNQLLLEDIFSNSNHD